MDYQAALKCIRVSLYAGFCPTSVVATIYLGPPLPMASSNLPADIERAILYVCCSVLLRMGFTKPMRSPATLVSSYHLFTLTAYAAVSFLWHFPAGHPGWLLATILPCGARTFLET